MNSKQILIAYAGSALLAAAGTLMVIIMLTLPPLRGASAWQTIAYMIGAFYVTLTACGAWQAMALRTPYTNPSTQKDNQK